MRLVDGLDASMGRVEFCLKGEWGTVCENEWDNNDTVVVCRQLGLPSSGRVSFSISIPILINPRLFLSFHFFTI